MDESSFDADAIAARLYGNPSNYGFSCDDDASEAIHRYWSKILRVAAAGTEESGTYLDSCLRWIAKSIRRKRRRREEQDRAGFKSEEWNLLDAASPWVAEPSVQYSSSLYGGAWKDSSLSLIPARQFLCSMDAVSKRILFLFLKCVFETDEDDTLRVSRRIGVPYPWLCARADDARSRLESETARLERLKTSSNTVWLRLRLLENEHAAELEPERRRLLETRIARDRARFARLRGRMRARRIVVPNVAIASLLGVPKGTVDSGLYYLKAKESLRTGRACG